MGSDLKIFLDNQRRKRSISERPSENLQDRVIAAVIIGIFMGSAYGLSEIYLSGVTSAMRFPWNTWTGLAFVMMASVIMGVVNVQPKSRIVGISRSSMVFALLFSLRYLILQCNLFSISTLPGWLLTAYSVGFFIAFFLAGMVPMALFRWSVDEQREYFDFPWYNPKRLAPIVAVIATCIVGGWVAPFLMGSTAVFCQ